MEERYELSDALYRDGKLPQHLWTIILYNGVKEKELGWFPAFVDETTHTIYAFHKDVE